MDLFDLVLLSEVLGMELPLELQVCAVSLCSAGD